MEKHNLLDRKTRLLNAAKRIIGLRETETGLKALNSLKTLKECDKKVVARYAKGVRGMPKVCQGMPRVCQSPLQAR